MRICIDSNQFIFGISGTDPASEKLMLLLPRLDTVIPRLIMREVGRNLTDADVKRLYALLASVPGILIVDDPVPSELVAKYLGYGLRAKADAFIGAFAEWQHVDYLITDNRHFLVELREAAFEVVTPATFLRRFYVGFLP